MKQGMLGHPTFTGAALYIGADAAYKQVIKWTNDSDAAGVPWVVTNDEQTPWETFNPPDWGDPNNPNYWHDDIRKKYMWGVLMAGGCGERLVLRASKWNAATLIARIGAPAITCGI